MNLTYNINETNGEVTMNINVNDIDLAMALKIINAIKDVKRATNESLQKSKQICDNDWEKFSAFYYSQHQNYRRTR